MPSAISNNKAQLELTQDSINCLESGRLTSFDSTWPHDDDTICSKENMAKAGFYFTGRDDCVKCFVCHIKLNNWNSESDEPLAKHQESSKDCLFAKLGKPEQDLTVEQWCDVLCSRALNKLEISYEKFYPAMEQSN